MAGSGRQVADATLVAALLTGATPAEAARRAGVSERTVRRRLRNPEFRARLTAEGDDIIAAAARGLADASRGAVCPLQDLLGEGPPAIRLGAAKSILELAPRWRNEREVDERLAAIERSLAELREGH